jgi:hypothetical protein
MPKLLTVRQAKEEIKRLQIYVDLAESYEADTLEKLIIKEYALQIVLLRLFVFLNEGKL